MKTPNLMYLKHNMPNAAGEIFIPNNKSLVLGELLLLYDAMRQFANAQRALT